MANIFEQKARHVVPSFRAFADTAALGELSPASRTTPPALAYDFDELLLAWQQEQSMGVAADLVSAALVSGHTTLEQITQAAEFILGQQDRTSPSLQSAANTLLNRFQRPLPIEHQLPRLSTFLETNNREITNRRIHKIRQATHRFGEDPILFVELARLYSIIGNSEKAKKCMRIALALAPGNRFVLRSAARMYAHYAECDRAYSLLRTNPGTFHDPWLASAQLALGGLLGRQTHLVKPATAMLSSNSFSPLSLAELASGLGTIELLAGNRRRSKELFRTALSRPNDNALAQTEWAFSIDRLFDFDLNSFDVKHNYEALALEAFGRCEWADVIRFCESWFMDMPFTRRPVMMASHVATIVLENYSIAQTFCRAGLVAHPRDALLLNNYAYALALDGKPDDALKFITQAQDMKPVDLSTQVCLTATKGLAYFRKGRVQEGRLLYLQAIEDAHRVSNVAYRHMAFLNYAREECLANQDVSSSVIEEVLRLKIDPKTVTLGILRDRVAALYEARSADADKH